MRHSVFLAVACAALVSGCGQTTEDRAMSGAGIGATAGAVLGVVTGMSLVQGVVIGAAAGGLTGALTDSDTIDLGKPFWSDDDDGPDGASNSAGSADRGIVRSVQSGLVELGYDAGSADGAAGPKTRQAIRAYQKDHDLLVDGQPTRQLAEHLQATIAG